MAADRFPIEAGHIQIFSQAIGDANPIYRDIVVAKAAGLANIPAPPTFVQAAVHFDPQYPMRPKPGVPWFGSAGGTGFDDDRHRTNLLHGEQHFEYFRPVIVGDVLSVRETPGNRWQRVGKRGGQLDFFETTVEYRDDKGDLVVLARIVGVSTSGEGDR
jgi:hypothetical protein